MMNEKVKKIVCDYSKKITILTEDGYIHYHNFEVSMKYKFNYIDTNLSHIYGLIVGYLYRINNDKLEKCGMLHNSIGKIKYFKCYWCGFTTALFINHKNELYLSRNGFVIFCKPIKIADNVKQADIRAYPTYSIICWVDFNNNSFIVKYRYIKKHPIKIPLFPNIKKILMNNLGIFVLTKDNDVHHIEMQEYFKNYGNIPQWKFLSNNVNKIVTSKNKLLILTTI